MKTEGKNSHVALLFIRFSILCSLISLPSIRLVADASEVTDFYYYYDERIYLNTSTEMITICFEDNINSAEKAALIREDPILEEVSNETLPYGLVLIETKPGLDSNDITEAKERLNELPEIKYCTPVFQFLNMKLVFMDEFVVRFRPNITEQQIEAMNKENGVAVVSKSPYRHNRYVLRVINPKDKNAIEMANTYNLNSKARYATPNFIVLGGFHNIYPNDAYFEEQWDKNNTGQTGGTEDADMDAPEGWQITTGSSEIVIAIIDTGTDIDHEDLVTKIWANDGEIPGNGIDDDGNGYVDDIYGWDFESTDNDPRGTNNHGTACAGLAAAETNNWKGIAGVCWAGKIMPLKIGTGAPITSAAADAIDYAYNNGADVLSNSWSVPSDADLTDAIKDAKNNGRDGKGCVIVFASGNDNHDVSYPATLDEVIAVGATDHNDARLVVPGYGGSNYGKQLDVVAPSAWGPPGGVTFWTTDISGSGGKNPGDTSKGDAAGNYYKWFGGTSGAAPQVAGLAGLILSVNPDLDSDEVQSLIQSTADDVNDSGGRDDEYGWGRVNIYNAVLEAIPSKGHIDLDKDYYNCDCNIGIFLADYDLKGANTVDVNITCAGDLEKVWLNETEPNAGVFTCTISTASGDPNIGDGILQVSHDETITVTYEDADDGTGNPASPNDTAVVDCVCPVIYDVNFNKNPIGPDNITVTFDTNEFSYAHVLYGESCVDPNKTSTLSLGFNHSVKLKEVSPLTDYYFIIEATDLAGNETVDNNDSNCYRLTTDGPKDINVPGDFNTIQEAIDQPIWDGSRVIVAEGTYNESIDFKGKGITVTSTDPNDWDVVENTIIYYEPPSEEYGVVVFNSGEDSNSILAGFTAKGSGTGSYISINIKWPSNPTVTNCIITDTLYGITCQNSSPMIKNNKIFGISEWCVGCYGNSTPVIDNNWIYDSIYEGGSGVGIYFSYVNSTGTVQNNTIVNNKVGILVDGGVVPEISNCIIWDNDSNDLVNCTATYSCIKDPNDANGVGNICGDANDPMFVDPNNDDYHLDPNSPCFNAGDPNYEAEEGETDIDGDDRIMDGRVDMGADEIDCLFVDANEYDDWVAWGKPECWCFERQCRGDTNGEAFFGVWVSLVDKYKLDEAFNKTDAELRQIEDGICADLNHTPFFGKRVTLSDLNILKDYFNESEPNVPPCDESPIITGPYNFWTN